MIDKIYISYLDWMTSTLVFDASLPIGNIQQLIDCISTMDYRPQVITLLLFYLLFIRNVRTLDYYTDDVFESKTHPDVYSPNMYPKFESKFFYS